MLYGMKNICFFVLAALCLNSVMIQASERRQYYPVPKQHKDNSKGSALSPFIFIGTLQGMISHIHFPSVDFSYAIEIAEKNKITLSIAMSFVFLSLLARQVQRLEKWNKWCSEKYVEVSTSVDNYTNDHIKEWPTPIQMAVPPIKVMLQFLCDIIKKYIAMNNTAIVFAVASPVTGKLLDCVWACPIPLLNFTSIGWIATGGILTKGFFDSHFEKVNEKLGSIETKIGELDQNNMQQHKTTQQEIGMVRRTITTVTSHVDGLFGKIKKLKTGVGQVTVQLGEVVDQVKNVLQELTGVKEQVHLLHNKIDANDKKDTEQYEALKAQLEQLQKSYTQAIKLLNASAKDNEELKRELGDFKDIYQRDNVALREDLRTTSTHLSEQITGVKEVIKNGFASQRKLLNSTKDTNQTDRKNRKKQGKVLPEYGDTEDIRQKMLQFKTFEEDRTVNNF
jgi:hypothetical protein